MAHQFLTSHLQDSIELFRYYKKLAERAMAQCPDEGLFATLDGESNSIAIIVKHMVGNMRSRWTDFLISDGEKPDRHRDTEFEEPVKSREELLASWERGWKYLFDALGGAQRRRSCAHRLHSHGAPLRNASHQPAGGALLLPHWANHLSRQALRR